MRKDKKVPTGKPLSWPVETEYENWVMISAGWSLHPDYEKVPWNSALTYNMIFAQPVVYEFERIKTPTLVIRTTGQDGVGKEQVSMGIKTTMGDYPSPGGRPSERFQDRNCLSWMILGIPHIEA